MKSKATIAIPVLENMTTEDLRATAKKAGIKVGKSRKATVSNLTDAIAAGAVHFKANVTLSVNPAKQGEPTQRQTLFGGTFRTYLSGPGEENIVWLSPSTQAPIQGSPFAP